MVAVVLLERIEKLGQMGQVVNVKPGYARNFLLPLKKAFLSSLNICAVKAELSIGVPSVLSWMRSLGVDPRYITQNPNGTFTSDPNAPPDEYGPSLTLGGYPITLLEHVSGISVYADMGVYHAPDAILQVTDSKGTVLYQTNADQRSRMAIDPGVAYIMAQIMADDNVRTAHLKDTTDLYADIKSGNLPAVSYVKPSGWVDGHPASSKWDLFEGFTKKIVDAVQANPSLWKETAIFITVDEGGGYYDAGYIQALDFFGDGTRIPLLVVSPYSQQGKVVHWYYDHVSLLKFIERNWSLPTITKRSRDNLPEPRQSSSDPYVPTNSPALGDLFGMFDFEHPHFSPN